MGNNMGYNNIVNNIGNNIRNNMGNNNMGNNINTEKFRNTHQKSKWSWSIRPKRICILSI